MKKTLYILLALMLGLVSCNKTELEAPETKTVEESGLVAITMKIQIPEVELVATTKADGKFSHDPSINSLRVAVFGVSGYPQAYAYAEPIASATDETPADYASTNYEDEGDIYYFKVLLPVYDGEAHVHVIANGPESIPFVDEKEETIMETMRSEAGIGAYWARVVLPDGILTQLDQNGIMQTDDEGNYIASEETAHLFEDLVLVRNFAEVKLSIESSATADLHDIYWTLVNVPSNGSVAPMAAGTYVEDYQDYEYYPTGENKGKIGKDDEIYNGFMFDGAMDLTYPKETSEVATVDANIWKPISDARFLYERPKPVGGEKLTCILMKAKFRQDTYYTYYRIDLSDETLGGSFPIYRNFVYQVKIHKVGNRGAKSTDEAMNRDSGGNVSLSLEAQKLTDVSDGESRLFVEYVERNFTSGGKYTVWVQYVPDLEDIDPDTHKARVDNDNVLIEINSEFDNNALASNTITKLDKSTKRGYNFYEFTLKEQDEEVDLTSVLRVSATNYTGTVPDDKEKSTLYRNITLRVMHKMNMALALKPSEVVETGTGKKVRLEITLPDNLPESMFPLEIHIEDINHTINPTGYTGVQVDGDAVPITVPVKTAKSYADGSTNSFYFIRTVNKSEYDNNPVISTEFETVESASATTIYVANEFFKTKSINLLNDGIYVNPLNMVVPFNTTSVTVEVDMDPNATAKTWTVTAGSGVTVDKSGTQTGKGSFTMSFDENETSSPIARTATVRSNGEDYSVTIIQNPIEFTISPKRKIVLFNETTHTVTIHAEEGTSWKANVSSGASLVGQDEDGFVSGEGTQELTVNFSANEGSQREFTITATTEESSPKSAQATIVQRRKPNESSTFNVNSFTFNNTTHTASATSSDEYVSIRLSNIGNNPYSYIQMGRNTTERGVITIVPVEGMKITGITVTYSSDYGRNDATGLSVSSGDYTVSDDVGTWEGESTGAITINNGYRQQYGGANFPRITKIVVTYEPI